MKNPAFLSDFTSLPLIDTRMEGSDSSTIIRHLSRLMARAGAVPDESGLVQAILKREALCSTLVAPGLALPHARMEGIPNLRFAVGRPVAPVSWGAEGQPVRLVLLFAVPHQSPMSYMTAVAALARLSQDAAKMSRLFQAPDQAALFAFLATVPLASAGTVAAPPPR
jgi:mannitol/fructose-specific phosphotransferase system IIA component (Ntr-type)